MLKRKATVAVACILLAAALPLHAEPSVYLENVQYFRNKVQSDTQIEAYCRLNKRKTNMVAISERLKELNYIPFSVDDKQSFSYSVLAGAMLFCQQMQIGGLDESLSGWQQQVLFSDFAQPSIYSWVNLSRKGTYRSVIAKSDFKISAGMNAGSACCVKGVVEHVESQDDKQVVMLVRGVQETRTYRITYQKPERSCDYLAGDHLIVFGTLESKTDDLAVISAQLIGFEDA